MKKQDLEVYQANSFIEGRQEYTVNEKRLLSTIISFVKPTDKELIEYELSIKDWAKMLKVSPKALYQIADEVTTGLMMKIISMKDPKALTFEKWHVLDRAKYTEGILTLKISNNMNDIFLQLRATKNYTHYELAEFVTLTSTHAQRIYELVKQYQHSEHRKRPIMKITELKEKLAIEDKYPKFVDFRRNVLDIAEKQIHENTTLRYKWRAIKRGRSYHQIEFYKIHTKDEDLEKLREIAYLDNCIGEQIYNEEFGTYLTIKKIEKNKDKTYSVHSKDDDTWYDYPNKEKLQECIAKAIMQKGLI